MKLLFVTALLSLTAWLSRPTGITITLTESTKIDSLGACQGVSYLNGKVYLYGDREVGMIRTYSLRGRTLVSDNQEVRLTENGKDVINHPTGIAYNGADPTFIGNSIRLNPEGTSWRAVLYCIDWEGLLRKGTLDGNLLNVIEDDACIQGTRPEYVRYQNKWYVATADYGGKANEVRLYDPALLRKAKKTSEPGVVVKKFTCSPWVQNLHWISARGILVLVQNQIEGRRWRLTFLDLNKSLEAGTEQVLRVVDFDRADELEGFTLLDSPTTGLAVTSSRAANVNWLAINW